MNHDIINNQTEIRNIFGCNVRVLFTEKKNPEVESYVVSNLYKAFEKRNNISNGLAI